MEGNHQSLKTITQWVVSLHLCHSNGHKSLGTQHGITQYVDSKLYLQDTFFLTDLFCGKKNTPDLFFFFFRQSSRGQRLSITPWRVQDPRVKDKSQRLKNCVIQNSRWQGFFCKAPDRNFFFDCMATEPLSQHCRATVPQRGYGHCVATNNRLDVTRRLSLPALTTTQ